MEKITSFCRHSPLYKFAFFTVLKWTSVIRPISVSLCSHLCSVQSSVENLHRIIFVSVLFVVRIVAVQTFAFTRIHCNLLRWVILHKIAQTAQSNVIYVMAYVGL